MFLIAAAAALTVTSAVWTSCGAKQPEKYREIVLASPVGKEIKLSEVVGDNKYTLLDFWASWCPPCMREIPYLTKAYADYKDKGFEIYGVSYDKDAMAWTGAIKRNKMDWVHVSALSGWDCPTKELYGVQSIPHNLLIDSKGNIVARDLRGAALEKKLAELLD